MSAGTKAVFLSYASQDAEAARRIAETLRATGVEVWFDADGGLEHGDEWDAKIRKQIKECVLFMPIISANTQAREEGYFRIEWELAAQRAMGIASGVAFILPVVIDETREPEALVPDRFRMVQWTRLPGGVVTPEVQARFLKLWSHRAGVMGARAAPPAVSTKAGEPPALPRRRVPVVLWIAGSAAVVGLVLMGGYYFGTKRPPEAAATPMPSAPTEAARPAAPKSAVPLTEARQLVARAWTLLDKPEMGRAELETADALCKRAAGLDPTDAEVWAAWTHVNIWLVHHNFDRSAARYEAAADCAARAMRLDPGGFEARLAQACYWVRGLRQPRGTVVEETRKLLRRLLEEKTDEPRALSALGYSLLKHSPTMKPEGHELLERLAKNPAFAALAWMDIGWEHRFRGDFAKAEEVADKSIAATPYWNNLGLKIALALEWRGDPELALATLKRMPPAVLQEDFGIGFADWAYEWSGKPGERLTFLNGVPKEWLNSQMYVGPRAYLVGRTRLTLGQKEAGERELRRALEIIEQRLAAQPNDPTLLLLKALTLHFLGERPEAEKAYRVAKQVNRQLGHALFEEPDTVLAELERGYERQLYRPTAASLRLNPDWAPLRELPRFKALQAKLDADPRTSPHAAAPNPDGGVMAPDAKSTPAADKSVAVLPFANQSADKDNEYFSEGIAGELLTVLQKIPGLKVTAQASAWSFKGKNATTQEVGEKLGVAHVVSGSVQKSGQRVKITARLSRAATNEEVWSQSFGPLELTDVFATQTEIATAIVAELRGRLTGEAATRAKAEVAAQVQAAEIGGTRHVEAHELYLRGRFFGGQFTLEGLRRAEAAFRRAVELDPKFGLAWASLAQVARLRSGYENTRAEVEAGFELARQASARAVDLFPNLAAAHVAQLEFRLIAFDWRGAVQSLQRVAELGSPAVHECELKLGGPLGDLARAAAAGQRAVGLDPVNPELRVVYAWLLLAARRYADAEAEFRRGAELSPTAPYTHAGTAIALLLAGRAAEASAEATLEHPGWARRFGLALTYWGEGKRAEATAVLQEMIRNDADVGAYQIAQVHAYRDDANQAFEWLERAFRQRDPGLISTRIDPFLAVLHADARWEPFRRKLGLHDEQLK